MSDVLFAVLVIVLGTLVLFYPLGVTIAAARAAYRAHGSVPALATVTLVSAAWYTAPLYTFVASIPLLIILRVVEIARARRPLPLPRAIVMSTCPAPR